MRPLFLAFLGHHAGHVVAGLPPRRDLEQEFAPGILFDAEPLLRHERIVGIAAVVHQALGVPGLLVRHAVEERARLIDVADSKRARHAAQQRREAVGALAREQAELRFQGRRLDEYELGRGAEIVGEPGLRGVEPDARRGGDGDRFDGGAGTLRHRIELPDRLDFVAEEIQAVRLARGHRIHVDDAAPHRVMSRRLADRLGVVVEIPQQLEQALERLSLPAPEGEFAPGKFLERRHRLQQGRGRGHDDERVRRGHQTPRGAQPREHGQTVVRGGECLAHVAAVRHGFGKNQRRLRSPAARGRMEEQDVLGEMLSRLQALSHDEPDRRRKSPAEFRDDGAAGGRADAGELVAEKGRDDLHGRSLRGRTGIDEGQTGSFSSLGAPGSSPAAGTRAGLEAGAPRRTADQCSPLSCRSVASASCAAFSSACFFEVPRPVPSSRSWSRTATTYSRAWCSPSICRTS